MNVAAPIAMSGLLAAMLMRIAVDAARRARCPLRPQGWLGGITAIVVLAGAAATSRAGAAALPELTAISAGGVCAVTDLQTGYVFDRVVLFGTLLLCLFSPASESIARVAYGALACGGTLGALHVGTRGRGIGLGDVKLGALLGAAVGVRGGLELLGIAFIAGGAVATTLLIFKRKRRVDTIAFAPFLAVGVCTVAALGGCQ